MSKSTAQKYRELVQQNQKQEPLFEVLCPSGMAFKCTKPNLQIYLASGRLPSFLQIQMKIVKLQQKGESEFQQQVEQDENLQKEVLSNAIFVRDLILRNVREPRLVETPTNDEELGFDELLPADFEYLGAWMVSGGNQAQVAEKYRQKRRHDSANRTNGQK
jgi:hypothetical protein